MSLLEKPEIIHSKGHLDIFFKINILVFSSVQFSRSVVSDSL